MADIAASVLARLKNTAQKQAEAINYVYNFFARRNFCEDYKNRNMRKILS